MRTSLYRELPVKLQCLSLSALWLIWGIAAGYVWWKQRDNSRSGVYFDNGLLIQAILLLGIPFLLVYLGVRFLRLDLRLRQSGILYALCFALVVLLTVFGTILLLYGIAGADAYRAGSFRE